MARVPKTLPRPGPGKPGPATRTGFADPWSSLLDTGVGHRRTHEKTDYLINNFDSRILWDAFGIYEDLVVRDDVHERFQD